MAARPDASVRNHSPRSSFVPRRREYLCSGCRGLDLQQGLSDGGGRHPGRGGVPCRSRAHAAVPECLLRRALLRCQCINRHRGESPITLPPGQGTPAPSRQSQLWTFACISKLEFDFPSWAGPIRATLSGLRWSAESDIGPDVVCSSAVAVVPASILDSPDSVPLKSTLARACCRPSRRCAISHQAARSLRTISASPTARSPSSRRTTPTPLPSPAHPPRCPAWRSPTRVTSVPTIGDWIGHVPTITPIRLHSDVVTAQNRSNGPCLMMYTKRTTSRVHSSRLHCSRKENALSAGLLGVRTVRDAVESKMTG